MTKLVFPLALGRHSALADGAIVRFMGKDVEVIDASRGLVAIEQDDIFPPGSPMREELDRFRAAWSIGFER